MINDRFTGDRSQAWQTLRERADADGAMKQLLDSLSEIEDVLGEDHEFDAPNLKLPYEAGDADPSNIWK